jgi:hypothetical protein
LGDNYSPALIAAMYNRRVDSVGDVLDHIHYNIVTSATDGTTPLFLELFKRRLKRYLEGTGHPSHPFIESSGLANEYENDMDSGSSVLRAQCFLLACTESDLLPVNDDFKIEVSAHLLVNPQIHFVISFSSMA